MAWNEPGGGNRGDKDPWGNRDDEGPPDLDEAFRKLQQNLSQMFGGGGGNGSSGGSASGGINTMLVGLVALARDCQVEGHGSRAENAILVRHGDVDQRMVLRPLNVRLESLVWRRRTEEGRMPPVRSAYEGRESAQRTDKRHCLVQD